MGHGAAAFDMAGGAWQSPRPVFRPVPRPAPPATRAREEAFLMAKPELGLKRVCVACSTKFYDLMRAPAICPKCGTEQPAEQPRLRRASSAVPEEKIKKRVVVPEAEADEVALEDVEADETIEDAEELEDDAEGIGEDLEVEGDRDEEV
jgi:uncharacterized protein (TIGR02300 family)